MVDHSPHVCGVSMIRMELAARLAREAAATNERRMLVLSGDPARTRESAREAIDAAGIGPGDVRYVGPEPSLPYERIEQSAADQLLGSTQQAVVLDCHDACPPNALGQVVGGVDGGGLLVLLTPPLDSWPDRHDGFDDSLAVPPFGPADVSTHFRQRFVELLHVHRGITIVDVDTGTVLQEGLTKPAPRIPQPTPTAPSNTTFPGEAYDRCRTQDQVAAVFGFETLRDGGQALVLEADRGRGKSSAAGLASACLTFEGTDILVTAPGYRHAREVFVRARELLSDLDALAESPSTGNPKSLENRKDLANPKELTTPAGGRIRFVPPTDAADLPGDPDRVIVDEAAMLPVDLLESFLTADGVAFATTIHGYEGTGRSFAVRFRDRLERSDLTVTDVSMSDPIRYAPGDPIEVWAFRTLALDARPAVDPLVSDASVGNVTYRELSPTALLEDENLLREVFGLLVQAHYRTEPNDLARLLDAPNVSVHALLYDGHAVSVVLLAQEGNLPADVRASVYEGERIKGNLLPDVLMSQLRDESAGKLRGHRVLRITTHSEARSRGLGSKLLAEIRRRLDGDWFGVGYGATPELVEFWTKNGFRSVHLATSRNDRSGEHSVLMCDPLSDEGQALLTSHTDWFLRRLPSTLTDPLADLDPDVVRAVCRSVDGTPPLDLTEREWQLAVAIPYGPSVHDTAPRPVRRLALHALVEAGDEKSEPLLTERQERLLVRKTLQAVDWETVATELDFDSTSNCKRELGTVVGMLVEAYGNKTTQRELERLQQR